MATHDIETNITLGFATDELLDEFDEAIGATPETRPECIRKFIMSAVQQEIQAHRFRKIAGEPEPSVTATVSE